MTLQNTRAAELNSLLKLPDQLLSCRNLRESAETSMASLQHETARKALAIIGPRAMSRNPIRGYQTLAVELGRPATENHGRAIGQVCDLLDAAAALVRRPLMALWTVRSPSGEFNPKAFRKNTIPGLRELILAEADGHTFTGADVEAIGDSLDLLKRRGNRAAWEYVYSVIPQHLMFARLSGTKLPPFLDGLDDLGSDYPTAYTGTVTQFARDPKVRAAVLERAKGLCEFCGKPGFECYNGSRYLECHHIIALAKDGRDRMTNVIALCPDHHRQAHFGTKRQHLEEQMIQIVANKELTGR